MPRVTRIATAGGFNNPALNLNFVPDLATADQNALLTQQGRQQNTLRGMDIANAPADRNYLMEQRANAAADREYEVGRRPVRDTKEGLSVLKSIGSGFNLQSYLQNRDKLLGFTGLDETFLPTAEQIQANAAEYGQTPEESFKELQQAWSGKADTAKGGIKVGDTRNRHEKVDGRWFKTTQEYDGDQWNEVDRQPMYKVSSEERAIARRNKAIDKIEKLPPMEAYSQGWRMNDDGTLHIDAADNAPVRLKTFTNTLGKRANMKIIKQVGEHVDDSIEVYIGLQNPKVQADLKKAQDDGMWDKVEGRWSNAVKAWMMRNGISGNSKTFKTIMHMQRMASEQRKTMLGTAVTQTELQSILAWMPNAGDSYETMTGKITLAAEEGYEEFKRWLDINKDESNMAPFYKAWNLDRFDMPEKNIKALARSGMAGDDALPAQSPMQARGDELEAQGMPKDQIIQMLKKEFPRRADGLR